MENNKYRHMKTTKRVLLFFILITTTSCVFDGFGIQGNQNVVREDRTLQSDFTKIKVSQGINLFLTQGNEIDMNVEADENIIALLKTEVVRDELRIYFEKDVSRTTARNVYLVAARIEGIKTSSGAHVKNMGTIVTDRLDLNSSSGSGLTLNDIVAKAIVCSSSSGSNIELSGETKVFKSNASSGSHINAKDLTTEISQAAVSSGAGISTRVTDELNAHASSGGSVSYVGNPAVLNKSKSSGGSISKN